MNTLFAFTKPLRRRPSLGLGLALVDTMRMRDSLIIQAMTLLANLAGGLAILLLNPQLREA